MATKHAVTKSQAVRDYLKAHPGTANKRIVSALTKQGIEITSGLVATVKAAMYRTPALPIVEEPADTLTPNQLKIVARAINTIRQREALAETAAVEKPADTLKLKVEKFARAMDRFPRKAPAKTAAQPPIGEKPANTLTSDQLKKAARAIKTMRARLPDDPDA